MCAADLMRFENRLIPVTESGCWLWLAGRKSGGYGAILFNGKQELAHRVSWILYKGKIPKNKWVLHKCDTPMCVNPDHLFLGTRKDNIADQMKKRRHWALKTERNFNMTTTRAAMIRERDAFRDALRRISNGETPAQQIAQAILERYTHPKIVTLPVRTPKTGEK